MSQDYNFDLLGFPGAISVPLKPDELITNSLFIPTGSSKGILLNSVEFGCFRTAWEVSALSNLFWWTCIAL
jgi:transitional endoplasmic reticulum ATPase